MSTFATSQATLQAALEGEERRSLAKSLEAFALHIEDRANTVTQLQVAEIQPMYDAAEILRAFGKQVGEGA